MRNPDAFIKNSSPQDPAVPINLLDDAALYFTSGTTGTPKPILLTHRNLEHACILENRHHNQGRKDTFLLLPPLYHNDLELVEKRLSQHRHELAAVITEPVMLTSEVVFPEPGFLKGLRDLTSRHGVLLIFDEVITGFRLALGGAQEYYQGTGPVHRQQGDGRGIPHRLCRRQADVMEIETPSIVSRPVSEGQLSNVRCSLAARPGRPFFLRTSPEFHMKRLLCAGAPDIFQIGKAFRDGELGALHLPEFTQEAAR